jgi:hypothetical protein
MYDVYGIILCLWRPSFTGVGIMHGTSHNSVVAVIGAVSGLTGMPDSCFPTRPPRGGAECYRCMFTLQLEKIYKLLKFLGTFKIFNKTFRISKKQSFHQFR